MIYNSNVSLDRLEYEIAFNTMENHIVRTVNTPFSIPFIYHGVQFFVKRVLSIDQPTISINTYSSNEITLILKKVNNKYPIEEILSVADQLIVADVHYC
jgi:hypothetical protein